MSTNPHISADGVREDPSLDRSTSGASVPSQDESLPPQLHAGKVGYGPDFGRGVGTTDKLTGLKEELIGKVKRNPELVQQGHDRRTGVLQRREHDEADRQFFPDPSQEPSDTGSSTRQDSFDRTRAQTLEAGDVHEHKEQTRENAGMI